MTLSPGWLNRFVEWAQEYGFVPGDSLLDIGASEMTCGDDPQAINHFVRSFGGQPFSDQELQTLANHGIAGAVFVRAGFQYTSIDYGKFPYCVKLDLNRDGLPSEHVGRYKFVSNSGTSEHILNQYNTMKVIHDATAQGGIMYHGVPMSGEFEHGIFNYNAKFFPDYVRC